MTRVSVEVPAELTGPVRETVLLLYEATAESARLAVKARTAGRGSLEDVDVHRARLAELDDLFSALDAPGPGSVSAPRDLLHDALYGALIDAGERLPVASERAWRGELPLERVREAAEAVLAIDRVLRALGPTPEPR
jgi:hypothetical protein